MTDLSYPQSANSYIVATNETINSNGYRFLTNKAGDGITPAWSDTNFKTYLAYPAGESADLSGNGVSETMIQNSCVSDVFYYNNYIYFQATGNEGNAKLSLTYNGSPVWTWHIWCTDRPAEISGIGTGSTTYTILDRNMGAITGTSDGVNEYMSGFYYTYGHYIGFSVEEFKKSRIGGWDMISSYGDTPEFPYLKVGGGLYQPFRSVRDGSHQTTLLSDVWTKIWVRSDGKKTMYDPCPPGYRVMSQEVLSGYTNSSMSSLDASYYGIEITGSDSKKAFIPYNGRMFRYNSAYTINSNPSYSYTWEENNTGFVAWEVTNAKGVSGYITSQGWQLFLWTAKYDSDDNAKCYYIRRKGIPYYGEDNTALNGGIISDKLTYGKGVRCMKM